MSKKRYQFWSEAELKKKINTMSEDAVLFLAGEVFQSVGCYYSRWILTANSRRLRSRIRLMFDNEGKDSKNPVLTKRNIKYDTAMWSMKQGATTATQLTEYVARTRSGLAASKYIAAARKTAQMRGKTFRRIKWSGHQDKLKQAYKLSTKGGDVNVRKGRSSVTMNIGLKYIRLAYTDAPKPPMKQFEAAAVSRWLKSELKRNKASNF